MTSSKVRKPLIFKATDEWTLFAEEEDQDDEGDHDANDSLIEALLERIEELGIRVSRK